MALFRFYLSGTILASHFRFARTQPEMAQLRKSGNGPVQILLKWYDSGNPFPFCQNPTLNGPLKEIWKRADSDFTVLGPLWLAISVLPEPNLKWPT
jgi:hypothetical protein